MEKPTDEALMQEVSEGNLDSMTILFERYHQWIYNFFFQMIQNQSVCEDLIQNTFYKAIRYRNSYKGGKFASWIFQIARNISSDYFKQLQKERLQGDVGLEKITEISEAYDEDNNENIQRLKYVLKKLPVKDRELLVMSRFQGMKYKQIAEVIGSTEIAVKTKTHRAIKKLKTLYFESIEI